MASQCKRQQCTIDRRGFRQELDSWRHKLIHCVGFESILEGLFGPELVEDLKLFKDLEPTPVSDWSFDENCLFCCLRRDKVKEHLIGLNTEGLEDKPKPLLVKDQIAISRLEKQAEEFLNAVLCRKDVPNFSDPHIPVVAREILQRMIRQFAAEYTSKTSSPQDSCSDFQPHSDQSLQTPPLLSGAPPSTSPAATVAGPAHNQNPVLSKLLMADQDAPLDLTIKKPLAVPSDQDGVLDLSIKKNRFCSSMPAHSPCLSPATSMLKGRSLRADGQVGLFMRSLQDGRRRENIGHSARYKTSSSLASSMHVKEEADLESDPESPLSHNHSSRPTDLFRNGSATWNSKTHFGAFLKLKTTSEASERLKDIPRLLEAAGLLTKSLAYEKGNLQEACGDQSLSLSHSPSFDLKIPQVRVLATGPDPSWDSLSTEYSGSLCENGLGKTLRSLFPKRIQKKSGGSFSSSGSEKDYWPYDADRQALSGNYPLDSESDLGNKQPRKKRGRYRQYNTELLEEAIVVVMDGKMSVSKAQSVYGIPHSTLEYKVKERLGTLKNPPKKKLKLISQVEELDVSRSPKRMEFLCSQQVTSEKSECTSEENGNDSHDGSLSSNNESAEFAVSKAKELQSTSTLEQFMAKLCPHHQRQIVDAIGFLQTEVKAFASSSKQQDLNSTSRIQGTACSSAKSSTVIPERCHTEITPKSELQEMSSSVPSSCAIENVPEDVVSLKTPVTAGQALDLHSPGSESNQTSITPTSKPMDTEDNRHGDHVPLKMKIVTGKTLSCVLNTSLSSHSDTLEEKEVNSSSRAETPGARLSSSVKRHNHASHTHQTKQRETLGQAKDTPTKLFSVHMTTPPESPRTARKTIRASSDHGISDSACQVLTDPDLGHCDIVFIDRPITDCLKEKQTSKLPRRNARKSTRGHMYSNETWELKTVRTLAGRGNCPNPMPELITLVTPKQILSKPDGVPPVDMPFAAACRDPLNQQRSTQDSTESVIPGTGDIVQVAASDIDIVVETSQTDQCQGKEQSVPPSPVRSPIDNEKTHLNTDVEQSATTDSGITIENKESVAQAPCQAEIPTNREPQEIVPVSTDQTLAETPVELSNNITTEEAELEHSPDELVEGDRVHKESSGPSPVNQAEEEKREENKREELQDKQLQKPHPETLMPCDDTEVTRESSTTESSEELIVKEPEVKASEAVDSFIPLGTEDDDDDDNNHDVSSKTLDALLKELPPWRRKKGTVISLPKWLRQSEEVVVGYINGRPISASDRSLRRRSSNTTISPTKTPVKSSQCSSNRTSAHSAADANLKKESKNKDLPETPMPPMPAESLEATPVAQQGKETSSSTQLSSKCKLPLRTKLKRALRGQDSLSPVSDQSGDHSQSPESKRQLRSSGPRPTDSPVSKPTSDSSTSVPPTVSTAALTLPSTDHLPIPVISPFITSPSLIFGHSQQNAVPDTNQGLNDEQTEPATTTEDTQETEDESRMQSRVKQSTAKTVTDESKPAKIQASDDTSSISEDQSPIKTEMQRQSMPLRSKRFLRKEAEATDVASSQKPNAASSGDESASVGDSSRSVSDKPTRMPLRSESSKSDISNQSTAQSPPVDNKKLALRSQRLAAPSTSTVSVIGSHSPISSPIKLIPEKITKVQMKPPQVSTTSAIPNNSAVPFSTQRLEPPKQTPNKFFETLTGEENQHLITNLNVKYDKMHKGWIQMDKEGQPAARYKNKADRQAAIWKSKRRARKTKSLEHQKYSPVQMLFMKGFNLTSICRWFLESTETKSLVIVKKVNTRLPSETQLCFHSSSGASGSSQGVFPSLQAERLKKHLKKFAIASPVKSNPKSQKLIARALELEANKVKGKERKELPSTTQALTKPHSSKVHVQIGESQKSTGKAKNPASARILRKYSNIREKMQAQQTNVRKKEASKTLRTNSIKRLNKAKAASKSDLKPPMKAQKPPLPANKQMKESVAKMERRKPLVGKATAKHIPERTVKAQMSGKASRDATKKELPKRSSQRLLSPKLPEHKPATASKTKGSSKKQIEEEKAEVVKPSVNKNSVKIQTKESSQAAVSEIKENTVETPQQSTDVKVPPSPDQILTRSQRKMEAAPPLSGSPSHASKRATKSTKTESASPKPARKAEEATLTRSGAIKSLARRSQGLSLLRSATKSATKRAQELSESPAKRTRTSLSK